MRDLIKNNKKRTIKIMRTKIGLKTNEIKCQGIKLKEKNKLRKGLKKSN